MSRRRHMSRRSRRKRKSRRRSRSRRRRRRSWRVNTSTSTSRSRSASRRIQFALLQSGSEGQLRAVKGKYVTVILTPKCWPQNGDVPKLMT